MKQIIEKHPVLTCFLVVLLAYLPIASFLFAIKNDFFAAYFPLKFFLSESLRAGQFPLWNPYLNYGFPTYGDMSLGYWNPGTWLIAALPGYNAYTFTLELLAYLFLAVWGMYKLCGIWLREIPIRQLAAIAYACCGFMVGHLQHFNWITGAALVPVSLYFMISFLRQGAVKNGIASVLSCFWLISSAHPGISIGFILFCIPLFIHLNLLTKKHLVRLGLLMLATLLLSSGMIYGYTEVLPFTNRSSPVGERVVTQNATTAASWVSFFFSLPVTKNDAFFQNDISMRNCFMGILLFASLMLIVAKRMKGSAMFFLITGFIFLILSSDLVLPFYKQIPLVNYVRLNSEFRLFALLPFIIGGALALKDGLLHDAQTLQRILRIFCILLGLSVLTAIGYTILEGDFPLENIGGVTGNARQAMKTFISGLGMADTIIIHGSIQLAVGLLMLKSMKAGNMKKLFQIGMLEIMLATLLQLPFTGVGQLSPQKISELVSQSPRGLPTPSMMPEHTIVSQYPDTKKIIGSWELYSKQIAMNSLFPYPLIFRSTLDYFDSGSQKSLDTKPAFFFTDERSSINQIHYAPNRIHVSANISMLDTFVVKQNNYTRWNARVDGKDIPILVKHKSLMGVSVQPGQKTIELNFRNEPVKRLLMAELIAVALLILAYTWISFRKGHRIRYIFP
jgi:hypothetical protein